MHPSILKFIGVLLLGISLTGTSQHATAAQEATTVSPEIILSGPDEDDENASPYAMADLITVAGNAPVRVLRRDVGAPAVVSFAVNNALLMDLLGALARALDDGTDQTSAGNVIAEDEAALLISVTLTVETLSVDAAIDQVAIASNCNIYRSGLQIVIDRCQ